MTEPTDPHRLATLIDDVKCSSITYITKEHPPSYEKSVMMRGCGNCHRCRLAKKLRDAVGELLLERDQLAEANEALQAQVPRPDGARCPVTMQCTEWNDHQGQHAWPDGHKSQEDKDA